MEQTGYGADWGLGLEVRVLIVLVFRDVPVKLFSPPPSGLLGVPSM